MAAGDPTDNALAAIASILDHPPSHQEPEKAAIETSPPPPQPHQADGYSKAGPGPMAAIRFRWTIRRATDNAYYVDETIGENSTPVVTGPMSADAAIKFVDERESEAQERFAQIKTEMANRAAAADIVRKDRGEM